MKPRHRRVLARWAQAAYQASEQRVSGLVLMQRSTLRYQGHRDRQEALRLRLKEPAANRVRFGYRRLTVLKREGWRVNAKRIYRLYSEEGLTVRTKYRRKAASRSRVPQAVATAPNQRWSMDFVSDRLVG